MAYRATIDRVGVLGGGTVGAGIALAHAIAGKNVVIFNRSAESSSGTLTRIERLATDLVAAGQLTEADKDLACQRIQGSTSIETVADCDHVIEAVPEDLMLKREVLAELNRCTPADVVIASTTSGLRSTELAEYCDRPERILVTRYFLPAHLIPLVEVVPGKMTAASAADAVISLLRDVGKQPVVCRRDLPGGIAPRLQRAVVEEAFKIVADDVASPAEVDSALVLSIARRFGVSGVFERLDLTGLDTVQDALHGQGRPIPAALSQRTSRGDLGVKTGNGFYRWTPDRVEQRERAITDHLVAQLPPPHRATREVVVEAECLAPFLAAATDEYESCTPTEPPRCFAILLGRSEPDQLIVNRVAFGRNVRDRDPIALAEFADSVIPCFGKPYANPRRGFWCDPGDLLRISRAAEAGGLEILGSIHLHPDWHRIGPPGERGLRISEHPTPMDRYMLGRTGWPLNMICYLERRDGALFHTIGAWNAESAPLAVRFALSGGLSIRNPVGSG